jgi:hypothetical protein
VSFCHKAFCDVFIIDVLIFITVIVISPCRLSIIPFFGIDGFFQYLKHKINYSNFDLFLCEKESLYRENAGGQGKHFL